MKKILLLFTATIALTIATVHPASSGRCPAPIKNGICEDDGVFAICVLAVPGSKKDCTIYLQ